MAPARDSHHRPHLQHLAIGYYFGGISVKNSKLVTWVGIFEIYTNRYMQLGCPHAVIESSIRTIFEECYHSDKLQQLLFYCGCYTGLMDRVLSFCSLVLTQSNLQEAKWVKEATCLRTQTNCSSQCNYFFYYYFIYWITDYCGHRDQNNNQMMNHVNQYKRSCILDFMLFLDPKISNHANPTRFVMSQPAQYRSFCPLTRTIKSE